MASVFNDVTATLKTVTDKDTAEAARPKLTSLGAKMKKRYDAAIKKYPDLSKMPEDEKKKLKQAFADYKEETIRLLNMDDGGIALQAFDDETGRMELGVKDED